MLKNLRTHFISGLLVLAPLFLTLVVINYLVKLVDKFMVNPVFRFLPISQVDVSFQTFLAKLLIAVLVFAFVTLIGLGAEKFFIKQLFAAGEGILKSIPVFNKVYGSIQEIAQAFFGDKKGVFKKVVFIEYPRNGIYALGFITHDRRWAASEAIGKDVSTVFIPTPPNPATGYFVFVPNEDIIESELTVEEGIKLIVSGGTVVPSLKAK